MIEAENLMKRYGTLEAVRGVSFRIDRGELVGLLGPNGAGKTTIMRILTCYHFPSDGTARIGSYDVQAESREVRRLVGYLPENAPLYPDLTPHEYLSFIADARGLRGPQRRQAVASAVEQCAIEEVYERPIGTLSKGYRQRVGIAQAILHSPEVLILDEPTSGLDPNQILEIRHLLSRLGERKTVILSTHILAEVEAVCRRVLILHEGKIVAEGSPQAIAEGLSAERRYRLEILGKGIRKETLKGAAGVKTVSEFAGSGDRCAAVVVTGKDERAGEMLFDWAVARGYKIISMVPLTMTLEEVFSRLTAGVERKG